MGKASGVGDKVRMISDKNGVLNKRQTGPIR